MITAALILVVAAVVGVGTALAHQSDTHIVAAPDPAPGRPSPLTTPADARIDFVTDQGTGELVLLSRSWSAHRPATPETDRRLQVRVELVCTTGTVDYDPGNFQAFDDYGRLYDVVFEAADESVLDVGTLQAGESVRGSLGFDLPRGQTTLLMTDGKDQAVTALQVPD